MQDENDKMLRKAKKAGLAESDPKFLKKLKKTKWRGKNDVCSIVYDILI